LLFGGGWLFKKEACFLFSDIMQSFHLTNQNLVSLNYFLQTLESKSSDNFHIEVLVSFPVKWKYADEAFQAHWH